MQKLLESYLKRLTNLSGNNRSILLLRIISDQFIDLFDFNYENGGPSFSLIEGLIANKSTIKLCDEIDPRDSGTNSLSMRLKKMDRMENFIFHERGSKDLYVGWPFVKGKFSDGTMIRCPLIFFPVEIRKSDGEWVMKRRKDVNVTFNKSFLLGYAHYNKVSLDEELLEMVLNDFDPDATVFRTELYQVLKESNLEIDFNKENFKDELTSFKNFRRSELEKIEKNGQVRLEPEAVLGIFPQAGSYLVPDYVHLIENNQFADIEQFFLQRIKKDPEDEGRTKFSDRVLEENTYTPFELDAYQEESIKKIKKGNSSTIQGPPGTGKSQLISNLICDFIARGKNVLLVCQKRAALDVVFDRLRQKDVHDFVGLVHDFKNDRKDIFEKIQSQIEKIGEYRQKNNALDTIYLERTFNHASRKIESITEELEEYRNALFDEMECGKSVKELYLSSNTEMPVIHLKQVYNNFKYDDVDEFERRLDRYLSYYDEYENKPHFWAHEVSFANFTIEDLVNIKEAIDDMFQTFGEFIADSRNLLHKELDYDTTNFFLEKRSSLEQLRSNLDNEEVYASFKHMLKSNPDKEGAWLVDMETKVLSCFEGAGIETSLKSSELGRFQESIQHALKARKNPFGWLRWQLFSKDRIFITRVLVANKLKSNKEGFTNLISKIDNRLNYEHNLSAIQGKDWLGSFPQRIKKTEVQNWFFYQRNAYKSYDVFHSLRNLDAFISFKSDNRKEQVRIISEFIGLIDRFPTHKEEWKKYLSEQQIRELLSDRISKKEARSQLDRDFENLHDYHSIQAGFSMNEKTVVDLIDEFEGGRQEKLDCFKNSLALAWIDHIESKYPVLRTISSLKFDQNIKELRQSVDDKRRTSQDIVILKTRERTYEDLEYNRLNNLVTYRDLQHQVTKKKKIWPLRRVIAEHKEEIFKLIPCWMTSPESASAIFPMEEIFDLVIYDEASQCFAERGIPSMYRGKQIIVVGDSKQLKPFDLYRVKWEEESDEDLPELEIDSLLELASRHLPSSKLQGHYRSQSIELVDFSNHKFYNGDLHLIPHISTINQEEPAISYVKVDGKWEANTNHREANEVLNLVEKIQKNTKGKSVGIVTFNAPQQSLILDLIEKKEGNWLLPETNLFVKNIENVQGDERDIIVFSTAYAKDDSGKLQLKFGSLNLEGGENRLNVAITRAREKIYLITSLDPSDLKVDSSKNRGPVLLRDYLQYASNVSRKEWEPMLRSPVKEHLGWYLKKRISDWIIPEQSDQKIKDTLPFADLVVETNGKQNGLILTDDDIYFAAKSSKDIYVYQQELFTGKKWPNIRLDSRDIWMDPKKIRDRMKIYLNRVY